MSEDERGRKSNIILMAHKEAGGRAGLRKRKEENDGLCPKGDGGGGRTTSVRISVTPSLFNRAGGGDVFCVV